MKDRASGSIGRRLIWSGRVVFIGRDAAFEGVIANAVRAGFPPCHPSCPAGPARVQGPGGQIEALHIAACSLGRWPGIRTAPVPTRGRSATSPSTRPAAPPRRLRGLLVLAAMTAYHVGAVLRAAHPGIRGVEALATTVLLFLLLFAATYFLMSHTSSSNFNVHALTRTDSIYFTVTVFATVGFGDISPASQVARLVVTAQMIFNLIVLGLGVRLIVGAVQQARQDNPDGRDRKLAPDRASA